MLRIQLLGGFHLQAGAEAVTTLTVPRLQGLLAYLVLHGQTPLLRQQLAFLFWPDSTEAQARTNLRHALHDLRLALPGAEAYLDMQTQWVQWRSNLDLYLDVTEFEAATAQAEQLIKNQQIEPAVQLLSRAIELYRGPFLPNCYDDWILTKREELAQHYAHSLEVLLNLLEGRRELAAATGIAQRLLRHDPLAETTYQHLMRLHALSGDRASAVRVYHECVAMLARELGVEPSTETRQAYDQLLKENLPATSSTKPPVRTGDTSLLIGREVEWQQLLTLWQHASQGHAQVVAITGEAGIGKTKLAESLANWVSRQGLRAAAARVYEAEGAPAYAPVIDLLRTDCIGHNLSHVGDLWLAQVARLLPEVRERHPHLAHGELVSDVGERQHFYEALARVVLGDGDALLLIIDDLQWCDRETLEWLRFLLRFAQQARLLLVVTVRSGEAPPDHALHAFLLSLRREHRLVEIALGRLSHANTVVLATHIAGHSLSSEQTTALYRQTEGNPLFVVEMVRAATTRWAAGGDSNSSAERLAVPFPLGVSGGNVPDSVQAVIQTRIAQLTPPAQEVAGVAAILGGSFSLELLSHVGLSSEDELLRGLDELWQRHILREHGSHDYDFSHPQIREVVYRQVSPMRRRQLHRRAAEAMERLYGQQLDPHATLIAAHYEVAGDAERAIHAYQRAARFAKNTYAYLEAVESLRRGLTLVQALTEGRARQDIELELLLDLGLNLMILKGFAHAETQQAYDRALALCKVTGAGNRLYETLWGLHEVYMFQGRYEAALAAGEHCWRLAQESGDPELLLQGHHALWFVYLLKHAGPQGLQSVVTHTQRGIELYRPEWHHTHILRYGGHDPGVCARFIAAKALWLLGYPDQAAASVKEAVELATQLAHPFTQLIAVGQGAKVYGFRGEPQRVLDAWEQIDQLAATHNLPMQGGENFIWRGWASGKISPSRDAVTLILQGIENLQRLNNHLNKCLVASLLAETQLAIGEIAAARQTLERAIAAAASMDEDYFRPELYRLLGHCWLEAGDADEAQRYFQQALEIAHQQQAKSLELRAAMSLSQLWAMQGKVAQAHDLLAGIYGWFTEGFDTADLRQAKALLLALPS